MWGYKVKRVKLQFKFSFQRGVANWTCLEYALSTIPWVSEEEFLLINETFEVLSPPLIWNMSLCISRDLRLNLKGLSCFFLITRHLLEWTKRLLICSSLEPKYSGENTPDDSERTISYHQSCVHKRRIIFANIQLKMKRWEHFHRALASPDGNRGRKRWIFNQKEIFWCVSTLGGFTVMQ